MSLDWGSSIHVFKGNIKRVRKDVDKGIQQTVDHTGEHLKTHAEINTPVKTGKGQNSWAKSTMGSGTGRAVTVFNTARTKKGVYYLPFVEYGTVHITPRRFFRRAIMKAAKFQKDQLEELEKMLAGKFNNG